MTNVDCKNCGREKSVFFDADLPSYCVACLPEVMCENCNGFTVIYEGQKANGEFNICLACNHSQPKKEVRND